MLLGEFVRINESAISSQHEASGNNKQRFREDHRHVGPIGYWSMYPLTENTTLICMFVDESRNMGTYYIPSEEPLFRKYPKRVIEDSFVNIHGSCPISIVDRVMDLNDLPVDARVAYLYFSSFRISREGMASYIKNGYRAEDNIADNLFDMVAYGCRRVKSLVRDEVDIIENVIPRLTMQHRKIRSAILFKGIDRTGSRIGLSFRGSLGNILERLFSHIGASPPPPPPTPITPRGSPQSMMREVLSNLSSTAEADSPTYVQYSGAEVAEEVDGREEMVVDDGESSIRSSSTPDRLLHIGIPDQPRTAMPPFGETVGNSEISTPETEEDEDEELTVEDDDDEY